MGNENNCMLYTVYITRYVILQCKYNYNYICNYSLILDLVFTVIIVLPYVAIIIIYIHTQIDTYIINCLYILGVRAASRLKKGTAQ